MLARYMLSSCVHSSVCLSVRLSVRLSVTSRHCTEMAKRRITQTTPHDSQGSFLCKTSAKFKLGHPYRGAKQRWGRFKLAIFNQHFAISQRRCKIGSWLLRNTNKNSYALYRIALFPVTFSDPKYLNPPHFCYFGLLFVYS